jgi:hypothetical protein
VIINTRWNVVAKGVLVLPILSLYTQQDAFTQSKNMEHGVVSKAMHVHCIRPEINISIYLVQYFIISRSFFLEYKLQALMSLVFDITH